jgi:hypothetical protein
MSFNPLKFIYNPPPTIEKEIPEVIDVRGTITISLPTSASGVTRGTEDSRAVALSNKLSEMVAASQYLQQVILQQSAGIYVSINSMDTPDVYRALSGIYSISPAPTIITISMYNQMLDTQMASMAADSLLGLDSPFIVNPYQQGDLMTVTNEVESQLLSNNNYSSVLPILLRTIKGDEAIFSNWQQILQDYPVMNYTSYQNSGQASIIADSVDVSQDLYSYIDDYLDRHATAYADLYTMTSGLNPVENDINAVVNQYITQPVDDMVRIVSMLSSLKSLVHSSQLTTFVQLQSDLFKAVTSLDRLMNIALKPFNSAMGTITQLTNSFSGMADKVGRAMQGGLKGMINGSTCSTRSVSPTISIQLSSLTVPGIDSLSEGLVTLGQHIDWAQETMKNKSIQVLDNFRRSNERRVNQHANNIELLSSLRSLDNLISFAQGMITQNGGSNYQPQSTSVSSILSNINVNTGVTFSIKQGLVVASPPNIPLPTTPVINVFSRGGLKELPNLRKL